MPENSRIEELFILAKYAEWAGDVEYCSQRLATLRELTKDQRDGEEWQPLGLLRQAGKVLEKRMRGKMPAPPELVVETGHLRGIVWQMQRREFALLAYMTEPRWEEALYRQAWAAAKSTNVIAVEPEDEIEEEEEPQQRNLFHEVERAPELDEGAGISWEENAEGLLCVVTVGDLGLIKIRGVWVPERVARSAEEVVSRFRGILERIDPAV